ncbi:MAG: hypothetical protein WC584_01145 [Candidatus Pacearchaeota archaeon]
MKCNFCNSDMEFKEKSDILVPIGNPKKIKLKADFYRCPDCGKELFRNDESLRIAKIVDDVNDKLDSGVTLETFKIEEGKIIV